MGHKENRKLRKVIISLGILLFIAIVGFTGTFAYNQLDDRYKVFTVSQENSSNFEKKEGEVLYLYNRNPEDNVAFNVNNLFPGDVETKYYCVKVSYENTITVKYHAEILKGYEALSEVLKCKVVVLNTGETLYDGLMNNMPKALNYTLTSEGDAAEEIYYEISAYIDTNVGNEYQNKSLVADFSWWIEGDDNPESGDGNQGSGEGDGNQGSGEGDGNQGSGEGDGDQGSGEGDGDQGSGEGDGNQGSGEGDGDQGSGEEDGNLEPEVEEGVQGIQDIEDENLGADDDSDLDSEIEEGVQGIQDIEKSKCCKICLIYPFILLLIIILLIIKLIRESKKDKDNDESDDNDDTISRKSLTATIIALSLILCICIIISRPCWTLPLSLLLLIILLITKLIRESKKDKDRDESDDNDNRISKKSLIAIIIALILILCISIIMSRLCWILPLTLLLIIILLIIKLIKEIRKKRDNKTYKKIIISIITILILTICLFITTFAIMTTTVKVENNTFNTGLVKINLNNGQAVINEDELLFEPGMTVEKNFFIENEGTADIYYKIYFDNVDGKLQDVIQITIKDGEKILYSGTTSELTRENVRATDDILSPEEKKDLTIYFHYPKEEIYSEDLTLSFVISADAVQVKNNNNKEFN